MSGLPPIRRGNRKTFRPKLVPYAKGTNRGLIARRCTSVAVTAEDVTAHVLEGAPCTGVLTGSYIPRAAADTSVGFDSRAFRYLL